jgi:hypothetical protein
VVQRALRILQEGSFSVPSVTAAIRAASKGPQQLAYELAFDAGLEREQLLDRAAGVFLLFACLNLTDDLQDGDAGRYLDHPYRDGPAVALLLHCAATHALVRGGVTAASLAQMSGVIGRAAIGNLDEVATVTWTGERYLAVGERIAGDQWSAYAEAVWSATPLARDAAPLGRAIGLLGHIAEDLRSSDPRLVGLSAPELASVRDAALACHATLAGSDVRSVRLAAGALDIAALLAASPVSS